VPRYYIVISGRSQGNKPSPTNATQEGRGLSSHSQLLSFLEEWRIGYISYTIGCSRNIACSVPHAFRLYDNMHIRTVIKHALGTALCRLIFVSGKVKTSYLSKVYNRMARPVPSVAVLLRI